MEKEEPKKEAHPPASVPEQIETLGGRWLVPLIGFIYACGFLIVYTYFKGFGITDLNFIQAEYIHVGSFFLIACIALVLPLTWVKYLPASKSKYPHVTTQTILAASLMLYVIFGVLLFAPPGFYHNFAIVMFLNFLLPAGMLFTGLFADWRDGWTVEDPSKTRDPALQKLILKLQWILLSLQFVVAGITYAALSNFWEMWHSEPICISFVGLMLLIFLYGSRLISRLSRVTDKRQKLDLIISNGCIIGLLAFFAIWSFSKSIYPFIPASKGGGDFVNSSPIHIIYKSDAAGLIPNQVTSADADNHLILLEENGSFFFVADNTSLQGKNIWQGTNKPIVYEISHDAVVTIIHDNSAPQMTY